MTKRKEDIDLIDDVFTRLGSIDGVAGNIVSNGNNLKGALKEYRKGRSKSDKAWFDAVKEIVKDAVKSAKSAQKRFDKLLDKRRELLRDGKFTSFSRSFREALEIFEDLLACCNRYLKKFDELIEAHGWKKDVARSVVSFGWPFVQSFRNYAEGYCARYKESEKKMRKVASLRT